MLRPQSALPEKQNQSAELEQEMEEGGGGCGEEGQEAEGGTLGSRGDRLTGPRELSNPPSGGGVCNVPGDKRVPNSILASEAERMQSGPEKWCFPEMVS